jgi:hypothetical protein
VGILGVARTWVDNNKQSTQIAALKICSAPIYSILTAQDKAGNTSNSRSVGWFDGQLAG